LKRAVSLGNLGYPEQGIDVEEIIGTIHARRAPMMHVSAGLEL
jgi:hypothetical protein